MINSGFIGEKEGIDTFANFIERQFKFQLV